MVTVSHSDRPLLTPGLFPPLIHDELAEHTARKLSEFGLMVSLFLPLRDLGGGTPNRGTDDSFPKVTSMSNELRRGD